MHLSCIPRKIPRKPQSRADLGRPQGRTRNRLLPHRETAQSEGAAGDRISIELLPGESARRFRRLDARGSDHRLTLPDRAVRLLAQDQHRPNNEGRVRQPRESAYGPSTICRGIDRGCCGLPIAPSFAQDAYPSRPITLINPFPPGGAADVVGRPFAAVLEPVIKQPVVIETKAGAAGAVGAQVAASAKPDGYTMLVHIVVDLGFRGSRQAVRPHAEIHPREFYPDRPLHRRSDGARGQCREPYKTLKELVDDAKSGRTRSILVVRALRRAASADTAFHERRRHQDAASANQWRRTGAHRAARQQFAGAGLFGRSRFGHIRAGKLRAAASYSGQRAASLPDVPTLKEQGYNVEFYLWVGLFAPKGTPDAVDQDDARGS